MVCCGLNQQYVCVLHAAISQHHASAQLMVVHLSIAAAAVCCVSPAVLGTLDNLPIVYMACRVKLFKHMPSLVYNPRQGAGTIHQGCQCHSSNSAFIQLQYNFCSKAMSVQGFAAFCSLIRNLLLCTCRDKVGVSGCRGHPPPHPPRA